MFATRHLEGLTVLDVGCGGGLLAESLARLGAQVTAIDPSAENIQAASYHSSFDPLTRSIQYSNCTIGMIDIPDCYTALMPFNVMIVTESYE